MTSGPIRNPVQDHLLTPQNSALLIIDYQPVQVSSIASRSKRELVANIVALAKIGKLYELPTVLATVNVKTGINQPTIHQITEVLAGVAPIDPRSTPGKTPTLSPRSRRPGARSSSWRRCGPKSASASGARCDEGRLRSLSGCRRSRRHVARSP